MAGWPRSDSVLSTCDAVRLPVFGWWRNTTSSLLSMSEMGLVTTTMSPPVALIRADVIPNCARMAFTSSVLSPAVLG